MYYYKKKEILEEMWKWGKDVRALERLIRQWRVIQLEDWWRLVWCRREEYEEDKSIRLKRKVDELEWDINRLNNEIERLKEENANLEGRVQEVGWVDEEVIDKIVDKAYRIVKAKVGYLDYDNFVEWVKWAL